jgi:dUTP pyrophosphatase
MSGGDIEIAFRRLREGVEPPRPMTGGAAGFDLTSAETLILEPGRPTLVPTGLALAIPDGVEGQVRPRSGLALRHGVGMLNAPGTIDSDYRGEVCVILMNFGSDAFEIGRGERIAQIVFQRVIRPRLVERDVLPDSPRGAGGFGHTGR